MDNLNSVEDVLSSAFDGIKGLFDLADEELAKLGNENNSDTDEGNDIDAK